MSINLHKKKIDHAWTKWIKSCWIETFYDDKGKTRRGLIWILLHDNEHEKVFFLGNRHRTKYDFSVRNPYPWGKKLRKTSEGPATMKYDNQTIA